MSACTCATDGSAARCPHHTQADFDAQSVGLTPAAKLRFLAAARKEYCHHCPQHAGEYEAMSALCVHVEHATAEWLADILDGTNDGKGWLPSWRWAEWAALLAAPGGEGHDEERS